MSVDNILNGESGASIRAKLNELIAIANHYSSSAFTASPGGGGAGNPVSTLSLTIYDSDGVSPTPVGHDTFISACAAAPGAPKTIYYTKGGGNMGAGIEVGDAVFADSNATTPLPMMKWFGYQEYAMGKAFYVTAGSVSEIQMCA